MAVAKRQERKKHEKMEQKKAGGRPSGETNSPPGQPNLHRADSRRHIKMGSQDGLKPPLWGQPALMPPGCTFLCLLNKTLSCK